VLNMEVFSKALNKAKVANLGIEQARDYELSLASYYEVKNLVDTALSDGIKKGKAEMELMVQEAQQREMEAQKEKEEAQQKLKTQNIEFAKMMLSMNKSLTEIMQITNLTEQEVLNLKD
jgi:predicted transposase YdaD